MITLSPTALRPEALNGTRFHTTIPTSGLDHIQDETHVHRHAAYLLAMGMATKDVATAMEVTPQSVNEWLRTPWFQERVTGIMREHGGRDLTQLFANEAYASLAVMLELRDNPKTPAVVRKGVCQDILDRHLGKPTQRVEQVASTISVDPVAEVQRLEEENKRLRQQSPN